MDQDGINGAANQRFEPFSSSDFYAYYVDSNVNFVGNAPFKLSLYKSPKYLKLPRVTVTAQSMKSAVGSTSDEQMKKLEPYFGKPLSPKEVSNMINEVYGPQSKDFRADVFVKERFMNQSQSEFYDCFMSLLEIKGKRIDVEDNLISEDALKKVNDSIRDSVKEMRNITKSK